MTDDLAVRMALWNELPERRGELLEFEARCEDSDRDLGLEPYIGAYSYISDILVHPYLFPLLDAPVVDTEGLQHCARALELMLSTESSYIEDAVAIRVIRNMLLSPDRWRRFRAFAGPLFKEQVVKESQYHWFEDEPVI